MHWQSLCDCRCAIVDCHSQVRLETPAAPVHHVVPSLPSAACSARCTHFLPLRPLACHCPPCPHQTVDAPYSCLPSTFLSMFSSLSFCYFNPSACLPLTANSLITVGCALALTSVCLPFDCRGCPLTIRPDFRLPFDCKHVVGHPPRPSTASRVQCVARACPVSCDSPRLHLACTVGHPLQTVEARIAPAEEAGEATVVGFVMGKRPSEDRDPPVRK